MKTQEYLASAGVESKSETNAKKETYGRGEAVAMLGEINHLAVARGKKVIKLDLQKDNPSEEEILKLILGPTGNLRAPTLRSGKKLIVGFNEEMYDDSIR